MKQRIARLIAGLILFLSPSISAANAVYEGKKVLYIDSYHTDFKWSQDIADSIQKAFDNTGADLKMIHWDSKNRPHEAHILQEAEKSRRLIEEWKPDVVIGSDDNVSKYLIAPYYLNAAIPFVFCGVNWECSKYGFPAANVTGMVEVSSVPGLITHLRQYAKGDRIGYLALKNESNIIDGEWYKKAYGDKLTETYIDSFLAWKSAYLELQQTSDMMIIGHNAGILDWNDDQAQTFVISFTKIPTGATIEQMSPFVLINFAKIAEEQGEWSAEAAKKILSGGSPADIKVETNKKGRIVLNIPLSQAIGVRFTLDDLKKAKDHGRLITQ